MNNSLFKKLEVISTEICNSKTSNSVYFRIGSIIVRLSDHLSENSKHDLAIFDNGKSTFVVIPMVGLNKEVQWFTKPDDVIDFIKTFESMARLMLKPPVKSCSKQEKEEVTISKITWDNSLKKIYEYSKEDCTSVLDELYKVVPERIEKVRNVANSAKNQRTSVVLALTCYLNQMSEIKNAK